MYVAYRDVNALTTKPYVLFVVLQLSREFPGGVICGTTQPGTRSFGCFPELAQPFANARRFPR